MIEKLEFMFPKPGYEDEILKIASFYTQGLENE